MSPQITRLDNGLQIVTDHMAAVDTVSLGVWVDVGTRHEPKALNGVAHLLEHMAFKGTQRRDARAIAEAIENVGGHLNAYTSRENTAYYAKVLKEDVALGVDILSDILQHSSFDPAELERERTVILQEIGQALDTPDDVIFDQFQAVAYPDQAMGRPVLGESEIIRTVPRDAISGYMRSHYSADRMIVSAAGAIDHDYLVDLTARAFDSLPAHALREVEPARYQGGDFREEKDLEQVHVVLGFPAITHADPDYHAASAFSAILGGGMSSRLFQEIREKRGLVYSVYSFLSAFDDSGIFGVYAGTGEDEVAELIPVLCDELLGSIDSITEAEVARARAQLKASLLMGLESTSARSEHNANYLSIFGRPFDTAEIVAQIDAVTRDAVTAMARRILTTSPSFAALGPIGRIDSYDRIVARLRA
jgi:predicted Zn-dependent peptidase